jgi:hypothetical protein
MVLIKVQYDAYNRQFKLLDGGMARLLEDGGTYLLILDVPVTELLPADSVETPLDLASVLV